MIPTGISADIVLRIRPEAYGASFNELAADISRAVVQLTRWDRSLEHIEPEREVPSSQMDDTQ